MTHSCTIINWPRIYARTCARIFSFFDNSGYFILIMYIKYTSLFIYFKDFFPMAFGIPDERTKSARKMRGGERERERERKREREREGGRERERER